MYGFILYKGSELWNLCWPQKEKVFSVSYQYNIYGPHFGDNNADLNVFLWCFQVVVLQQYYNDNNRSIEAKYVFPLDDNAAVCGFEAFINGKHIIGEYNLHSYSYTVIVILGA